VGEKKYEFRRRLETAHKPNRRNPEVLPSGGEALVDEGWTIVTGEGASPLIRRVAKDLQDYFDVSMNVSVGLQRVLDVSAAAAEERVIVLGEKKDWSSGIGGSLAEPRSYRLIVEQQRILVCGYDDRGVGQGSYFLEDLMNLREAPIVEARDVTREPLFAPRMAHSGWGLDHYPDEHLNAMAHAGIDAILLFVKDVDRTTDGHQDFNNLIDRAEKYGLDVYIYSYLDSSRVHPEDSGAEAYYAGTYGKIFEACPRFKGVILVGESVEFPSKDPNTTGVLRLDWPSDEPKTKPSPGWWPCTDYPQWVNAVKKAVRKHNAGAEIVFWTYNWGWAPAEDRLRLIRDLPDDITLLVTFEMFEQVQRENVTNVCVDYTLSFEGPGEYFRSEAEAASERGIKLYAMSNTGGLTWDVGVIPYQPMPGQWTRRHEALHRARVDWGLSGLMETHHYGWWPSFVSELTKWSYWTNGLSAEEALAGIARRDFGESGAEHALEAWGHWSEAIRHYVPTNEDQYGPFRVGPSYPMVFRQPVQIPAAWHALWGNEIVLTDYKPHEDPRQSLGIARFGVEIRSLERMLEEMLRGNACLERALTALGSDAAGGGGGRHKLEEGERMLGIGRFIANSVQTTIHLKKWYMLKTKLFAEPDAERAEELLKEMERVALLEVANAESTIPLVEADSRLGWEASMDYMTDREHLQWKIKQVRSVLAKEFGDYRQSLALTGRY